MGTIVSFWTDIARTVEPPRAADALYVQFPGKDLFLVVEAGEATGSAAQLVPMAAGAIVTGVAASNATSAARILDQALESANRTIADAKRFNPLVADILISVSVVLRDGQGLHYASVGSNAIYLRTAGTCRRLNEPESEARHLVSEGITADPMPGSGEESSRPSVGLGLPPEVFRVRQSASLREPDDYLLVLIGGRAACRLGPVHIETTSPVGDSSRTAERLLRQAGVRPEDGSAVCAAHRAHDVVVGEGLPAHHLAAEREPFHIPWRAIGGALAVLLLISLGIYFFGRGNGNGQRHDPVLSPTTLLTPKEASEDKEPPALLDVAVIDTGLPPLFLDVVSSKVFDAEIWQSIDSTTDQEEMEVVAEPTPREIEKAKLRREARALRRAERRRLKQEARERAEAERRADSEPDAVSGEYSSDIVQVMDFTIPEPDARGEDAGRRKRYFPHAKLEFPDVVTAPTPEEPPDVVSALEENSAPTDKALTEPSGDEVSL
jgi:hypothetical protein